MFKLINDIRTNSTYKKAKSIDFTLQDYVLREKLAVCFLLLSPNK